MSGRFPDWDLDRLRGEEAEAIVRELRSALLVGEVEVKRDDMAAKTRNLFIEYYCQTAAGWMESGILTTKATTWVWVLCHGRLVVAQPVWQVRLIADLFGVEKSCPSGSHPTRGRVIPFDRLLERAVYVMERDIGEAA